jgi:hypothetical protein
VITPTCSTPFVGPFVPTKDAIVKASRLLIARVQDRGRRSLRHEWHWIALALLGVASFAIRFRILARYPALPSPDFAVYLEQAHFLAGQDVSGLGQVLPPASILVLLGMIQVLDPMLALRLFAAAPTAFLALPVFFFVSRYASGPLAMMASILFVFAEGFSEMTGWGGAPEFVAMTLMVASILFFLRYLEDRRRSRIVLASLFAALVVGTHQLSATVLVLSVGLWAAVEILVRRRRDLAKPFARYAGLAGVLSLPFAPAYVSFAGRMAPPVTPLAWDSLAYTWTAFQFLTREAVLLWGILGLLAVGGGAILVRAGRLEGTFLGSMAIVAPLLSITFLRDNPARSLYYLYVPALAAMPGFLHWTFTREIPRLDPSVTRPVTVALVAFLVVASGTMVGTSLYRMSLAVDFYHAIEQPELEALDWLRANTARDDVIATAGLPFSTQNEGTRFAWWIEGYAERRSFFSGSLIYASFIEEREKVADANRFFAGNHVQENGGIRLVDNFPADRANPDVWVRVGGEYRFAFFFNDAVSVLRYEPDGAPGTSVGWSPTFATPGTGNWSAAATFSALRDGGNLTLRRAVTLAGDTVELEIVASVLNGTLTQIDLPLWLGWGQAFIDPVVTPGRAVGSLGDPLGNRIPFEVTVTGNASAIVSLVPTSSDPTYALAALLVTVEPSSTVRTFTSLLRLRFPGASAGPGSRWDAMPIASSYGVTYVFQSKRLPDLYRWFRYDVEDFSLAYENERVGIFAVRAGLP